jgi:hypothetical protein
MSAVPASLRPYAYETRWITPAEASVLLLGSESFQNRRIDRTRVNQLKEQILSNLYKHNPADAICVDEVGAVVNGQHRLKACVEAGVPLPVTIVKDVPKDVVAVIDRGKARTTSDTVKMAGCKDPTNIGPAVAALAGIEKDPTGNWTRTGLISSSEALDYYYRKGDNLTKLNNKVKSIYSQRRGKLSVTGTDIVVAAMLFADAGHCYDARISLFVREILGVSTAKKGSPTSEFYIFLMQGDKDLYSKEKYRSKRKAVIDNLIYVFNSWCANEKWESFEPLDVGGGAVTPSVCLPK